MVRMRLELLRVLCLPTQCAKHVRFSFSDIRILDMSLRLRRVPIY